MVKKKQFFFFFFFFILLSRKKVLIPILKNQQLTIPSMLINHNKNCRQKSQKQSA